MTPERTRFSSIVPGAGMSLYIHVPFCQTKCPYCDFNTYQGIEALMSPYVKAQETELELWGRVLDHPRVNTVFFGGGTPSYLPTDSVGRLLEAVGRAFPLDHDAEVTIEANPGDLTPETCARLREQGVNRLSIGVQSLDNDLLALLGRRHNARQALSAFTAAREAGFDNINLDLMYGLPRQTMPEWRDTLQRLLAVAPTHISLYCLTLEEGTPLHGWVRQGKVPEPDPDLAADMYHYAREALAAAGYRHYEISNWAVPGADSRHNLAYWLNRPYLGVGPGAHSHLGGYRFWDVTSPRGYIDSVRRWADDQPGPADALSPRVFQGLYPVGGHEYVDLNTAAAETMFLGLRLLDGMDLNAASAELGVDLAEKYREEIAELLDLGLLEREGNLLRLSREAYLIANQVFTRFLG
jgi:oxygen-independent coproporphyrinogen III oxidase